MLTARALTLTDEELGIIVKAHDLMDKIDCALFENDEDDFFFDREEVSRYLLTANKMISDAMVRLVGYTRWVDYEVKE